MLTDRQALKTFISFDGTTIDTDGIILEKD
jgi:hypothetical protein